ncbi:MAG: YjbH domain-containing protein [Alphaproteobacteria bacterium]|nr:YjbH domain-containing protein [Alphaproteobacteria bacterium]MDE2495646.1 YjbH domain-containing protein [Alphaproteobacteria bacterium]
MALIHSQPAYAQLLIDTNRNTRGEVGILDMPSGHMAPDGQLAFTVGNVGGTQRYTLSFQALPWLDAAFRYTFVTKDYYDRSLAVKIRLLRETTVLPDASLGLCNILGTGIYTCEYLAASKHIGNFDFTTGLGWGRMADNNVFPNPFGWVFSSFKTRAPFVGTGGFSGVTNYTQFFHGPKVGVFGGVIWQSPIDDLKFLAEYSSDLYSAEAARGPKFKVHSPVNLALSYKISDALSLSAGWFYGSTYGFTVSFNGDPTTMVGSASRIGPAVPLPVVRDDAEQQQALSKMLNRNTHITAIRQGAPWVHVPTTTERAQQNLQQALLSESIGVRDVGLQGATLVVDARGQGDAQSQCAQYAQIAASTGTYATSVAMADLQNTNGFVTICPIIADASYTRDGGRNETAPTQTAIVDTDQTTLKKKLRADMDKQSLYLDAVSLGTNDVWVYYGNGRYNSESEAAGRLARLLMADAPPSIETFHLIPTMSGLPTQEITIARSALERATLAHGTASALGNAIALNAAPLENPALDRASSNIYPYFYWSLDPKLTEHLFDPDAPLQFMVYADGVAGVQIAPGLTLETELSANIWNNYTFTRPAGSVLPHVRTDLLQYLKDGQNGISSLEGDYQMRLARDVFGEIKAGYLEDMYMGAGGEVLWRPENSRIAIGADLYQVWKRDFNRLFGLQNYNILTGHVSIYYQSPWYGLNFDVHVGRYLAGDYGGTFEITRRFASGVEVGAWATFTNVPFSRFGEGSFDKGIIIHIPFEWGLPIYSQSSYDLRLASLTRDGGQRLAGDDSLYEETRRTSDGEIAQHFDDLVEP